jgi:osmotically-inducible protein OsmY
MTDAKLATMKLAARKLAVVKLAAVAMALVAWGVLPQVAWGQYVSGAGLNNSTGSSTSSGMFGSRTLGGNTTGPTSSGYGSSGGGSGTGSATAPVGQGSTLTGSERFLQANRQGAFVGADTGDTSNVLSQSAGRNMQGLQGLSNLFSQANRQPNNNDKQNGKNQLRIPMRIAFTTRGVAPTRISAAFQTRLTRIPALQGAGQIAVKMEGSTAVLQGTVPSEADRSLAEGLALLEPGIAAVRNELAVAPAATTGEMIAPTNPAAN